MQSILLYLSFLNIVLTVLTILFVFGISRFPETPSRPYVMLTVAFLARAYMLITGLGYVDEVLNGFPTRDVAIGTVVSAAMSIAFLLAYLEKYVLLKKKYP